MADREVTCSRAWRLRSRGRPAFKRAASSWVKFTTSREGIRPRRSGSLSCQRVAASARLMRKGINPPCCRCATTWRSSRASRVP